MYSIELEKDEGSDVEELQIVLSQEAGQEHVRLGTYFNNIEELSFISVYAKIKSLV